MTIQEIVFYLLLIDSVAATLVTWFDERWFTKHIRILTRVFPPAKGWAVIYLLLVFWIGWLLYSSGKLTLVTGM